MRLSAVGLQLRSAARHRWMSWLFLGVLLGVGAGGVAAAFAASQRTETAYDRFSQQTKGFDLILFAGCIGEAGCPAQDDVAERLKALPGVVDAARIVEVTADYFLLNGEPADPSGDPCYAGAGQLVMLLSPDGRFGTEVNRAVIVDGRPAAGPNEVAIAQSFAERSGLGVGDVIVAQASGCAGDVASRAPVDLTIVGVQVSVGELRPEQGFYIGAIHGDVGLESRFAENGYPRQNLAMVRLQPATSVEEVTAAARSAGLSVEEIVRGDDVASDVQGGLDNDARTLALLALLAALGAVLLVVPVLTRFARDAMADAPLLRSLGLTRAGLAVVGAGHGLAIGLAAAPVVVVVQGAVSLITPVGRAAVFEGSPGWYLDVTVLALVALGAIIFSVVVMTLTAARMGTRRYASTGVNTVARRLTGWIGLSPTATVGVRMALEPRHQSNRVPVRSGVLGIALALATVVGVLVYRSSLEHLEQTPSVVGWNWDDAIALDFPSGSSRAEQIPIVEALSEYASGLSGVVAATSATFDTQPVATGVVVCAAERRRSARFMSFESGPGEIKPTMASGRAPAGPDEVALSAQLLEYLEVGIGDAVELGASCGSNNFTVVGVSVLPLGPDLAAPLPPAP